MVVTVVSALPGADDDSDAGVGAAAFPGRGRYAWALVLAAGLCGQLIQAQAPEMSTLWAGVWRLDLQRSTLDATAPHIEGQLLRIAISGRLLTLAADTTLAGGQTVSDVSTLDVNGDPATGPGGALVSMTRIDARRFDVIVRLSHPAIGDAVGTNHFELSADGRTLTETKTQALRRGGQAGAPNATSTTSVLVFERRSP